MHLDIIKKNGGNMQNTDWQTRAARVVYWAVIALGIYLIFKYALFALLPFVAAMFISFPIRKLASRSYKKLGGSRKAWGAFYCIILWCFIALLTVFSLKKLFLQAQTLFEWLYEQRNIIEEKIRSAADGIILSLSKLPFLNSLRSDEIINGNYSIFSSVLENVGNFAVSGLGKLAASFPQIAIGGFLAIIASFYMSAEEDLEGKCSELMGEPIKSVAKRIFIGIRAYVKAYFWLFILTFSELYIGFLILGRKYAFIIAFATALLDLLPLFGSGFVLVPWGVALLIGEQTFFGVGMLLLFLITVVVRQIAEPRLLAKELGIHPIVSLISMYVGLRVFGFVGMLVAPFFVLVFKELKKDHTGFDKVPAEKNI